MFDHEDGSCSCGGHAVTRQNKKTGHLFYGCSNFPKCNNTESLNREPIGDFFSSRDDMLRSYYEAFYEGDG